MSDTYTPIKPTTAVLVLASGDVFYGQGIGHIGAAVGEVCFNTAMTGYQEILTDPSYAAQIICFTFPHIGNTGTTIEDEEASSERAQIAARGAIFKSSDNPKGEFDIAALTQQAKDWAGLVGSDLAKDVASAKPFDWTEARWEFPVGYQNKKGIRKAVLIDYGVKRNILRNLVSSGLAVSVVPATVTADDILALKPDGVVLSNGPGDPAATGEYAIPVIQALIKADMPILGICLGHQMLALALGAKTMKMEQGHHGANHPVMDHTTDKVEIVSMNHGFAVDQKSLPNTVEETHVSLFDGTNCGIRLKGKPVFSVQHHPEASPGPQDGWRECRPLA